MNIEDNRFVLKGSSMEPLFRSGDLIVLEYVEPHEIRKLQVVLFKRKCSEVAVVHRVVDIVDSKNGLVFITKGDSAFFPDFPVGPDEILGRVKGWMKMGKLKRMTRFKEVSSYYWGRLFWVIRSVVRGPFYFFFNLFLPVLPKDFILLKGPQGHVLKVVCLGRTVHRSAMLADEGSFWWHPLVCSVRRKGLEEALKERGF
jgi:signal peptidase I